MEKIFNVGHSWISICQADDLTPLSYSELNQLDLLHHPEIIVYGRVCHQRRDIAFYSDSSKGYYYSGRLMASKPLTPKLAQLMSEVNQKYQSDYNGILCNRYQNGKEYISAHSDDERSLGRAGVLSITYLEDPKQYRTFRIRDKRTKRIVLDLPMTDHLVVLMAGQFQKHFTHEIPVETAVTTGRISLTFRTHTQ